MARSSTRHSAFRCPSAGRVSAAVLLSFLAIAPSASATRVDTVETSSDDLLEDYVLPPIPVAPTNPEPPQPADHKFTLRHIYHHGTYQHPELHRRKDIVNADAARVFLAAEDDHPEYALGSLAAKSHTGSIERLRDRRPSVVDPMVAQSRRQGFTAFADASAWTMDDILAPDVTDKTTVLSMAYMASDAYVEEDGGPDWQDVGAPYNRSADFGWDLDGLRGHIWADDSNEIIVIGLKGTSPAVFDGDGTTTNDKLNDNLFFSCCCAQQGQWTWHQVCDCATGTYSCNNTCVAQALYEENRYYTAARELYANVTELYPDATIWVAGHSLGGAVSSLLGLTYGLPAVTFEAVPEALAASRLSLPSPPGTDPAVPQMRQNTLSFQFGHTADPIYIGTCNGATATCSFAGYAMESACHTGRECVYDVVGDKGWRVGIGTHKIRAVIKDVILAYDDVPQCEYTPECRDCAQWKMYESNGTETTTTSSSTSTTRTRTRTSTCKTPGWWGCLDKTTEMSTTMTTSSTSSTSTSTCETPGWFGCKDQTTETTTTTSSTSTTSTSTSTCETPGRFWGCNDPATSTSAAAVPGSGTLPQLTAAPTGQPSLEEPDDTPRKKAQCLSRSWFGFCREWTAGEEGFAPDEI